MLKATTRRTKPTPPPMSEGAQLVEQYFDTVGVNFLKHSDAPDQHILDDWRPKLFSLNRLNPIYGGFVGVHRKRIGVGKDKLVWLESGSEHLPVLLLLHGFSAAKEHWLPLLPFFAGSFRVLMPDLPGWGESGFNPDRHYGLEEQTERLHDWLADIGVHKVNVVGNSMGGALAGLLTARYPKLVTTSVLMDALGLPGEEHTEFVDELLRGKNRLIPRDPIDVMKLTDLVFHNKALAASAAFFSASELLHRKDVNTFLFREMCGRRPDYTKANFENISTPTLVMWGKEDRVLHPSCALTFARIIKRSELCLFDHVGHLPMIETPFMCAQAIKVFVRKHM